MISASERSLERSKFLVLSFARRIHLGGLSCVLGAVAKCARPFHYFVNHLLIAIDAKTITADEIQAESPRDKLQNDSIACVSRLHFAVAMFNEVLH